MKFAPTAKSSCSTRERGFDRSASLWKKNSNRIRSSHTFTVLTRTGPHSGTTVFRSGSGRQEPHQRSRRYDGADAGLSESLEGLMAAPFFSGWDCTTCRARSTSKNSRRWSSTSATSVCAHKFVNHPGVCAVLPLVHHRRIMPFLPDAEPWREQINEANSLTFLHGCDVFDYRRAVHRTGDTRSMSVGVTGSHQRTVRLALDANVRKLGLFITIQATIDASRHNAGRSRRSSRKQWQIARRGCRPRRRRTLLG